VRRPTLPAPSDARDESRKRVCEPYEVPRQTLIPRGAECGAIWLAVDNKHWQAWLTDDEPSELAFFCPECAEREFGDWA
jgi:hypothetical protein